MARFLPQTGALFQHVPRTGGTWVEAAIDRVRIKADRRGDKTYSSTLPKKHCLFRHYSKEFQSKVRFIFMFVRHPVPYYASVWKFLHQGHVRRDKVIRLRWKWHPFKTVDALYCPDYAEWVERVLEQEPAWYTRMVELYAGPDGGECVQFIGRTETLREDFCLLMERLGYGYRMMLKADALASLPDNVNGIDMDLKYPPEIIDRIECEERVPIRRF